MTADDTTNVVDEVLAPQSGDVPPPRTTAVSAPFWEACHKRRLTFLRCGACGTPDLGLYAHCRHCLSPELAWEESAGVGSLYTWTVVWRPPSPSFEVPYAPAVIALDEGHHMISNMVGCRLDQLRAGLRVRVVFHDLPSGLVLPYFQPAGEEPA